MKRLALLVSLALLTVVGTTATTQAYYLDTPHNESNGIYCSTCHNSAKFKAGEPVDSLIDTTLRNAVCLQCHVETVTDPKLVNYKGPVKKLHASSSSTIGKFGTWTTECTQCHDVHFQGQLDWASDPNVYLATGHISANNLPYNTTTKTTTVAIDTIVANPGGSGWDDTTKWAAKGGYGTAANAVDNSRGLIFVPNKANPTETFEIVSATANSVTVKGKMTSALQDNLFGIIYGQSLKSYVLPNGGSTVNDLRAVKFYRPEVVAGTFGGFVDETAAATKPEGLCQVCHSAVNNVWKKDGTAQTHNVGAVCSECHTPVGGFPPAKNHSTFIVDVAGVNACIGCHPTKVAAPDAGHTGCTVCHTATPPVINTNVMSSEPPTVTVLDSLLGLAPVEYTGGTTGVRLKDTSSRDINNALFTPINCGTCHPARPGVTHGSHDNTNFAWDGNCNECHSGANIAIDVHNTGVNGCTICHTLINGGPRKAGDSASGVDGDATLGIRTSACSVCHGGVNTAGTIHHVSAGAYATNGNCVFCHKNPTTGGTLFTNHAGNHTNRVGTDPNCVPCHSFNVGSPDGAPVDGSVIANKNHDTCVSCHNTNGTLKTQLQVGGSKVVAMPDGGAGSSNGGGNCTACHGAYFNSHQNIDHATSRVTNTVGGCVNCHTSPAVGGARPAAASPFTDAGQVHAAGCNTCHQTNGSLIAAPPGAPGLAAGGGSCNTCHISGAATWSTIHTAAVGVNHTVAMVAVDANCSGCHTGTTPGASAAAKDAVTSPFIANGEVHNAAGCATCHDVNTGAKLAPYQSAVSMIGGVCSNCHISVAQTWTVLHTAATGVSHAGKVAVDTNCSSCHTATTPGTSAAAKDAVTAPFVGTGEAHNAGGCLTCHNATTGAMVAPYQSAVSMIGGVCSNCHISGAQTWTVLHTAATGVSHAGKVTTDANCTSCHTITTPGANAAAKDAVTTPYIGSGEAHNAAGCLTCHNATTGAMLAPYQSAVAIGSGGSCLNCHIGGAQDWFTLHTGATGVSHAGKVDVDTNCTGCHTNSTPGVSLLAKDAITAPFTGTGEVHNAGSCGTCHLVTNGAIRAAWGRAVAIGTGGTCAVCHINGGTKTWTTVHSPSVAYTSAEHADLITTASCAVCHGNPTPAGSVARDAKVVPYIVAGDVHAGGCVLCHNTTNGNRINGINGKGNATVLAGGDSKWECAECHTAAWDSAHTAGAISHATSVSLGSTTCGDCHTATAGNPTVPVNAGNNKVHDACTTCHETTGVLKTLVNADTHNPNWITAMPDFGTAGGSDGGGDCSACHGAYMANHQVIPHTELVYDITGALAADKDVVQSAGNAACASCHNDGAASLATFTSKYVEHVSNCDKCHAATRDINETTASGTTVRQWIAARVNDTTETNCRTCHVPNWVNNPNHAGHAADFQHTSTCQTGSCHAGADVVVNIHGNNCDLCHNGTYNATTNGVGPAASANGIDGDAGLAEGVAAGGSWTTTACTVCHDPAGTNVNADSIGGIHHDNKSGNVTCTTANCHLASYLTHTTSVSNDSTNCGGCHNASSVAGMKVTTVPYVVAGDVHSALGCLTCHATNPAPGKGGILRTAIAPKTNGIANGGNEAWVVGTNGGGSCSTCHSTATTGQYGFLHHDLPEALSNSCATTCHRTPAGGIGVAADHSSRIQTATATGTLFTSCTATCHTAAINVAVGSAAPVNPSSGLVHDSCRTCHTFNANNFGILVTLANTATDKGFAAGANLESFAAGAAGSGNGGGACTVCHNQMTTTSTSAANAHHNDSAGHTAIGQCEYCHTDPRNNSIAGFEETLGGAVTAVKPLHLPCEECHVTPKGTAGTSWNPTMTILSFNEGLETQKTSSLWNVDYTRGTANNSGHVIANTSGAINNWGICFGCHDDSTGATRPIAALPLHPRPTNYVASNSSVASAWASFLPGRAVSNSLGNFNFLATTYRATSTAPGKSAGNGSSLTTQWASSVKYSYPLDGGTATDVTIPDPFSTANVVVPMFADRVAETTTTPVANNIQLTSAIYTTSTDSLVVVATTDAAACNTVTLTATYRANGVASAATGALTGTKPNCTYTFAAVATNPTAGLSIVDVDSVNGQRVVGYVKVQP
jgi:hypothetical protein